jgi:hypothetical protein
MWPNLALKPAIRLRACLASQHNYQQNISEHYIQPRHGDANLLRESLEAVQQTAAVIVGGIASELATATA